MNNVLEVLIFALIAVVVLIATSIAIEVMRLRGYRASRIAFLEDRIASWWVILFIFVMAFVISKYGLLVLFAFCAFSALREFLSIIETDRGDHWALLAIMFLVLPLQFIFVAIDQKIMMMIFIPVYAFLLLPITSIFRSAENNHFLNRIAQYQWAMMLCIYCMSHMPALLFLEIENNAHHNLLLLVFLIFIVEMARLFQHLISAQISAPKIAKKVSHRLNIAGFFGGAALSALFGSFLFWLTPFSQVQAFGISFFVTIVALSGSLVMTAIKRDYNIRNFDQAIAGHGGFLDGFDAHLYAAPLFYHLLRYFYAA